MGMSASQVRLLTITRRIHSVENEAERIQNQKMLLGLQSDEAYEEYLAAMEQKNIEYAYFNGEQGNFDWDKLDFNALFANGYAIKVRQVADQVINNTLGNMYTGNTIAQSALQTNIVGQNGLYSVPTASNLRYTSVATDPIANPSITASSTLSDIFAAPSTLASNGFITPVVSKTAADLAGDGYTKVQSYGNYNLATDVANNKTKFYIDSSQALEKLINYINNGNDCSGLEFVLTNDITMSWTTLPSTFKGTLDGNGYTLSISNGSPVFSDTLAGTVKNLKTTSQLAYILDDGATIDNCVINCNNSGPNILGSIYNNNANITVTNTYLKSTNNSATAISNSTSGQYTGDILIENSIAYVDGNNGWDGFIPNVNIGNSGSLTIDNSYTNSQYLTHTTGSGVTITDSFTTRSTALTLNFVNPNDTNDTKSVLLNIGSLANYNIATILNFIAGTANSQFGAGSTSATLDSNNKINISINGQNYQFDNATVNNSNTLLNLVDELGLSNGSTASQTPISQTLTNPSTITFDIANNGTPLQQISIDLTNSSISTVDDVKAAIQTALDNVVQGSTVTVNNNNQIEIKIPVKNYTISNFQESASGYFNPLGTKPILTALGLASAPNTSTYPLGGTTVPGSGDFVLCTSWADVQNALGSNIQDSPQLLRELVYNAYAIIQANVYDEDSQTRDWADTSVATNTGLREKTDKDQLAIAEANYEAALRRIDKKEEYYDKELAKFDQERKALTTQLETLKTCIKENIDRTFKIFQG